MITCYKIQNMSWLIAERALLYIGYHGTLIQIVHCTKGQYHVASWDSCNSKKYCNLALIALYSAKKHCNLNYIVLNSVSYILWCSIKFSHIL